MFALILSIGSQSGGGDVPVVSIPVCHTNTANTVDCHKQKVKTNKKQLHTWQKKLSNKIDSELLTIFSDF